MPEMLDQGFKIAECTKQAMQQDQWLTLPFFYVLELVLLFYFVIHPLISR
jgi:hypothetical protein